MLQRPLGPTRSTGQVPETKIAHRHSRLQVPDQGKNPLGPETTIMGKNMSHMGIWPRTAAGPSVGGPSTGALKKHLFHGQKHQETLRHPPTTWGQTPTTQTKKTAFRA